MIRTLKRLALLLVTLAAFVTCYAITLAPVYHGAHHVWTRGRW